MSIRFTFSLIVGDTTVVHLDYKLTSKQIETLRTWHKQKVNGTAGEFAFLALDGSVWRLVEMGVLHSMGSHNAFALTKFGALILPEVLKETT